MCCATWWFFAARLAAIVDTPMMGESSKLRFYGIICLIWVFWSVLLAVSALTGRGDLVSDPDDYMRMVQVQDWLHGQSWFDVSQYRINPPMGGDMHWSRWVDVPIAAVYAVGSIFFGPEQASQFAFLATPLLLLALLMAIMASVSRKLFNDQVAWVAVFLIPAFPLLLRQFLPGRIDHHSWQIVMAALALGGLWHKSPAKGGAIIGLALAFWMHVSIEGLPFAAAFGGLLAFLHFFPQFSPYRPRDMRLPWFAGALTLASALLLISTRQNSALAAIYCDAVAWPLIAAMAISTSGILLAARIYTRRKTAMAIVAISAGLGAAIYIGASGSCALDPFGNLSPLVRSFWYETITEGLPIHRQAAAIIALMLFVPFIACLALALTWGQGDSASKKRRAAFAFLLLFATLMSFAVQRTGAVAQLFAVPLFGWIALAIVDRAKRIATMPVRVLITASLLVALLPVTIFVATNAVFATPKKKAVMATASVLEPCSTAKLRQLPKGKIFTTMAAGPDILYHTRHSVYASGYHRNQAQMHNLIKTMLGPAENAQKLLRASAVNYVVMCPSHFETQSYLAKGKANFAASLFSPNHPDWLVPVDGFQQNAMRVYRLTPVKSGATRDGL
jgi:hypothetical protein